jgi:hypothetical protein
LVADEDVVPDERADCVPLVPDVCKPLPARFDSRLAQSAAVRVDLCTNSPRGRWRFHFLSTKNPLTTGVNGLREVERKGVEPSTSALRTQTHTVLSDEPQGLGASDSDACTAACTRNAESVHGAAHEPVPTVQKLADPDLACIVDLWPKLPTAIKAAIVALVKASEPDAGT